MTKTVGLTGSISTGKSTVAKIFAEHRVPIIDADIIAREVVEPGRFAYEQITETFGTGVLQQNKELDRAKLGEIIFSDQQKREQLNDIVHPEIIQELIRKKQMYIEREYPLIVLDIPLLFEMNLAPIVDVTVVVYTTRETQLQRLMKRDSITKDQAEKKISSQMSIEEKAKIADFVIDNSKSYENTVHQCLQLLTLLKS